MYDALTGRHVLVIDNDQAVLASTAGLLRSWGCIVTAATSGSAALERLIGRTPDLIIADVHLDHGDDGIAAVVAVRRDSRRMVPAFLVSGDVSQETRALAAKAGLALLEKPATPLRLRTLSTRVISSAARCAVETSPGE